MPDCKGLRCAQLSHIASTSAAANNTERTKTTVVPKDLAKSTTKSAITGMNSIGDATTLTHASEISITASVVLLAMHPHIFAENMAGISGIVKFDEPITEMLDTRDMTSLEAFDAEKFRIAATKPIASPEVQLYITERNETERREEIDCLFFIFKLNSSLCL